MVTRKHSTNTLEAKKMTKDRVGLFLNERERKIENVYIEVLNTFVFTRQASSNWTFIIVNTSKNEAGFEAKPGEKLVSCLQVGRA